MSPNLICCSSLFICDYKDAPIVKGNVPFHQKCMNAKPVPAKIFSRKVFLGGLPPDIDDVGILHTFSKFGPLHVDWPGRDRNLKAMFPPKGYAFLYFVYEDSVIRLIDSCWAHGGELYYPVSSPSIKNKLAQIRPWKIVDANAVIDTNFLSKPQYNVFVGGIPRQMTSVQLAHSVNIRFGNVSYVAIFLDCHTLYPRGSGIVSFSDFQSYSSAILSHYIVLDDKMKCLEIKPFQPNRSKGCKSSRSSPLIFKTCDETVCSANF